MYNWHHRKARTTAGFWERMRMQTTWKTSTVALLVGLTLVGCSILKGAHRPEPGNALDANEPAPLKPGLTNVTIGRVDAKGATIWWRSPWQGQSTVAYGRDPHLMPVVVDHSTPTSERTIALDNLEPGTRYYFRVETATPLGVARSAVLSFRTADAEVPQPQPEPKPAAPAAPGPEAVSHAAPHVASRPLHVAHTPKPVHVAAKPAKPAPRHRATNTKNRSRRHDGVRTASR
jgi:hypothetical protein